MSKEGVKLLEEYSQRYWERIKEAKSFVPEKHLPDFLKLTNKVVIYDCKDGYVTIAEPHIGDFEIATFKTSRQAMDVFDSHINNRAQFRDANGNHPSKDFHFNFKVEYTDKVKAQFADPFIQSVERRTGKKTIYRPDWTVICVIAGQEFTEDMRDNAEKDAEKDAKTTAYALNLEIEPSPDLAETQGTVINRLKELLSEYNNVLEDARKEEDLQKYLKQNPKLLIFALVPTSNPEIYPKYQLGKEYETDFVLQNDPPRPFSHIFVEIEPATIPLFLATKVELRQRANHAISQLMDWRSWVNTNIAYIKEDFPTLDQCQYVVIMGRSKDLDTKQRQRLNEMNAEHNWRVLLTYDDIADALERLIINFEGT